MEALYSALEGEISTFMKHTQRCQEGFDLHSLYHVLLLVLPQSPLGQVESWQHLHRFAHCQPGLASPDMASSYVDWLASYLQHPSTLKERFDARVVVSLCENLYVHEEPAACPTQRSPLASIPHLVGQLFAHQHNWGLLLKGGALSQRVFSPQSLHDLHGFADVGPFVKVLRLVPDVFHQSLATADLAQKWVSLHHNSLQAQAATLRAQARRVSQHIRLLHLQQQGEGPGLAQPWQSSGMAMGACRRVAALAEERQKSLELEEYHHSILEADWLLEVRPILIHRIDAVLQCCQTLERVL